MDISPARPRGRCASAVAVMMVALTVLAVLAPAAGAIPIEGTGGAAPDASGVKTIEVVRIVTETVGVPYLTTVAIGLLAFAAAWLLATYTADHRVHRPTPG